VTFARLGLVVALLFTALPTFAQQAQSTDADQLNPQDYTGFEGRNVTRVDIAIQPGKDAAAPRALIQQLGGKPFSIQAIKDSVAKLQETKEYTGIQVSIEPETQGLRVTFILRPVYTIGLISFPGAVGKLSYTRMLQAANISVDAPYVQDVILSREKPLKDFFSSEGYFAASVHTVVQPDDAHKIVNITFECELGPRAKFGALNVTGVSAGEAADVQRTLESFWAKLNSASLRPGQTYSRERIDKSEDFLRAHFRKSGRLAPSMRIESAYDPSTNRADLKLSVAPGPLVVVKLEGAKIWKRTLRKLIPIYQEAAVDQDLVDEGKRNLVSYFQSKSFFDVTVSADLQRQDAQRVTVLYTVNRGEKHAVEAIWFTNNKAFSDPALETHIVIKKRRFPFYRGSFSQALLKKSAASVLALYKNAGFANAKVTPVVTDNDPTIDVEFRIDEGERDKVASLKLVDTAGNVVQPKMGKRKLRLEPGQPYSPYLLEDDRNQILAGYLNRGYPNVQFDSSVTPSADNPHAIDVVYKIDENRSVQVGEIVLLGTDHTRPGFVRSITSQNVKEGQPLSQGKLLQSESDLYGLGIFDWASVGVADPDQQGSQQEVLVRVHESKRNTMDVGVGIEVVPRNGNVPVGSVAVPGIPPVSLGNNFTVSQKSFVGPRFSLQFARHNLRGRAETAAIGVVFSRLDQRLGITYSDPDLHGTQWSSLFSASAERTTQNPIYTAALGQVSFQVERQLDRKKTKKLITRYSYQHTDLTNVIIPELVLPEDMHVRLSTVAVEFVRDTRDHPLDAHHGEFQSVTFGVTPTALGSTANFLRFLGQTSFYKPIRPWLTWANNFRLGMAIPFDGGVVPLSERFFTGGQDSLRGFPINCGGPQRGVSVCSNPADTSTCTVISVPVGGEMLAIFNSEARFPIPLHKDLGGVIFYDGGNVYSNINARQLVNDYTNSIGIGLRYNTRVGPIRIDVGRNLNPIPGVKATQYFITLGQAF
jgi:outer membrane protein insertion porin family